VETVAIRMIVEAPLATLARKLRMVGVDCEVAGEVLRNDFEKMQGLCRVRVDTNLQDAAVRRAAALGRLIVTTSTRSADAVPGVHYKLMSCDADSQFAEIHDVFSLSHVVARGYSRCGICNADDWCTLEPSEVSGQVPQSVCEVETEFYQCGKCRQIFWNGEKYANTMDSLKAVVRECPSR